MVKIQTNNYEFSKSIHFEKTNDSLIICNKLDNYLYDFNSIGKEIIEMLIDNQLYSNILQTLAINYETSLDEIKKDVDEFINSLIESGILIIKG